MGGENTVLSDEKKWVWDDSYSLSDAVFKQG